MKDKYQRTTVILKPETHRMLRILAITQGVSLSTAIDQIFEDYLKSNKK